MDGAGSKPNIAKLGSPVQHLAGLQSPLQRAEMNVLLGERWPALKPLPIFKYETDEYRAAIEFDKLRGEWVCRKISLPGNKVRELRGGLREIVLALFGGHGEWLAEGREAGEATEELPKDADRRRQAMLEWQKTQESGARYCSLRGHLSGNQQREIEEILRLTLTARQLQCGARNIGYVFEALAKSGGRLATLIEVAQRNAGGGEAAAAVEVAAIDDERAGGEREHLVELLRGERRLRMRKAPATQAYVELGDDNVGLVLDISETGMAVVSSVALVIEEALPRVCFRLPKSQHGIEAAVQIVWLGETSKRAGLQFVNLAAESRAQIANWIAVEEVATESDRISWIPVESEKFGLPMSLPDDTAESFFAEEEQFSDEQPREEQIFSCEPTTRGTYEISGMAAPESADAEAIKTGDERGEFAGTFTHAAGKVFHEISAETDGRRAAFAQFALQSRSTSGASVAGVETSAARIPGLEISGLRVVAVVVLVLLCLAAGLNVGRSSLARRLLGLERAAPAVEERSSAVGDRGGDTMGSQSADSRAPVPAPSAGSATDAPLAAGPPVESLASSSPSLATSAPAAANSQPAAAAENSDALRGATVSSGSHSARVVPRVMLRSATPSTILVSGPGDGSKPFRLVFAAKTIAASTAFAMTSQLSVLVSPEPGAAAHKSARLQAGELVSFVWPRYANPGAGKAKPEAVKVRAVVGELGQVVEVKQLSGSNAFSLAATNAIRQWRFRPTLLNKKPVATEQDVTIEFRPPPRAKNSAAQRASRIGR
jgi:hypothetical protein